MVCRPVTRALTATVLIAGMASSLVGQVLLNEANTVSDTEGPGFLSIDTGKPYEGYDYGALPHSGNNELPNAGMNPGNPFAPDLSSAAGTQTSFVDGFDINTNPRGFARIQYNGGEWIELVVTHDHTDLRGLTFLWVDNFDDDGITGELRSQDATLTEDERGAVRFSQHQALADVRAGTVITISENAFVNEVRDDYPWGFFNTGLDDTGHDYDLTTDLSFDPFDGADDWHIHFHLDESITAGGTPADTEYFRANSELEVSNEQWAAKLLDPTSTVIDHVRDSSLGYFDLDVTTGEITQLVGENTGLGSGFGAATGGGGVGDDEALALLSDPDSGEVDNGYYEDVDWSTFGAPNLFNQRTDTNDSDGDGEIIGDIAAGAAEDDTTLSQVQDFSGMRDPVRAHTYDWVATGTSDFGNTANWRRANDDSLPATGPATAWTTRLTNDTGGNRVAQVSTNTTLEFATVMASTGTMRLEVQNGATLTVTGTTRVGYESPGRLLVMAGGSVQADGVINADAVEAFDGGGVSGVGSITGDLLNSGGIVQPGSGGGGTLSIGGDFRQDDMGTLLINVTGSGPGDHGVLDVAGVADLSGFLELAVNGAVGNGTMITVATAAGGLVDNGLSLVGDANGFSLAVLNGTDLVLSFMGTTIDGDFNDDGSYNCADINMLTNEIANQTNGSTFDLTGDGSVDLQDRDAWLAEAGAENLTSGNAYLIGDATLDGDVDGQDFAQWDAHKFTSNSNWCDGDFNADGHINGRDFLAWNEHKFTSAQSNGVDAIPEPRGLPLWCTAVLVALYRRRA